MKKNALKNQRQNILSYIFIFICTAMLLSGCAQTEQVKKVETSGFLGDYSQLEAGGGDRALLYYVNPETKFSAYDKLIIRPVEMWVSEDIDKGELENLAYHFHSALVEELSKDYEIVPNPGPATLDMKVALTEAGASKVGLDIATTYLPPARIISEATRLATGTHSFVGKASAEMELLDSASRTRVVAVVDKRAGGKQIKGSTDTWDDVKHASEQWAEMIRKRLEKLRAQ